MKCFFISFIFLFGISFNANSYTLEQCQQISKITNNGVPQKVDAMTDLISTHCKLGTYFIYNYSIDNSIKSIPDAFKKVTIQNYCKLPAFAPLLKGMKGIELDYFNKAGKFIDKVQFSKKNC